MPVPLFPLGWNTVKTLVTLIPGEINMPSVLSIVAEVELAGGSFDKIFAQLAAQSVTVFPDPIFRPVAVFVLAELEKIAAASPTKKL